MTEAKIKPFDSKKLSEKKEDIEEIEDEEQKKEEKESLEELTEEYEEPNFRLNHFLANQHRDVSLEKIQDTPITSLEDLPPAQIKENNEEENIEYMIKNEFEEGKYQIATSDTKFTNPNLSDENKITQEQKRMYGQGQRMSEDFLREDKKGLSAQIKYIKPEDTQKKDSLIKKRFGEV